MKVKVLHSKVSFQGKPLPFGEVVDVPESTYQSNKTAFEVVKEEPKKRTRKKTEE